MTDGSPSKAPTIYANFSYRDADSALEWLNRAFGFHQTQAFTAPDGSIVHAEMTFGVGAIMIGSAESGTSSPRSRSGPGIYVWIDDVDSHYERSAAAGAHIIREPEDTEFGTRRYRVLDPEGYEWSFGTYRPATDNGDQ